MKAMLRMLRGRLRGKRGDAAVELVVSIALLILVFATLVTALVYVTQYFNAIFLCRRITRQIEIDGAYDAAQVRTMASVLGGDALNGLDIQVDATYYADHKIQLRTAFTVELHAAHRIPVLLIGDPIYIDLPIVVRQVGMSEVFWR